MMNKQVGKVILFLGILQSTFCAAEILQGLKLEEPMIRVSVISYIKERGAQSCKLAIGAGHISDPSKLHPDYQPEGDIGLTESIQGDYDFHQHIGWYAVSAEADDAFGSDMVGNVRVDSHQTALFVPNTWNIIWDESYHPDVLSAPNLFEKVFESLKCEGKFIFTLMVKKKDGYFVTGHDCHEETRNLSFNEKLAYQDLSDHFTSLEEVETFIRNNLINIGFSRVDMYPSSLAKVIDEERQGIFPETEEELRTIMSKAAVIAADSMTNPLLAIDEIFQHTGGMYYIVATK